LAEEAERVRARLSSAQLRGLGYATLARCCGLDLSGGACWALTRLARQGATPGCELARQAEVTVAEGRPVAEQLIGRGLVTGTGGVLDLTSAGHRCAEELFATQRAWLERLLAGWSPERDAELEGVLTKLSSAIIGEN
jgi:DNA-binding MarR family transcriptional regulator